MKNIGPLSRIWCDNIVANFLIVNLIHPVKTKHEAMHYHFVSEQVAMGRLEAKFVCFMEHLANILTKPPPWSTFRYMFSKLMEQLSFRLRGVLVG